jgi:hypothetical protein
MFRTRTETVLDPGKTLVFDFETRPGAYWYDDTTTTIVCAWAAKWLGEPEVMSCFLAPQWLVQFCQKNVGDVCDSRHHGMLQFRNLWEQADRVITHNGKRFDVPIINGAMDRLGLPFLTPRREHVDTLNDRIKSKGIPRSLEKLAERYELEDRKLGVSQQMWEAAYEFEPSAIKVVIERAESDVRLTEELYLESIKRGVLK